MVINTKKDLRTAYALIRNMQKDINLSLEGPAAFMRDLKESVRRYNRNDVSDRKLITCDGESYIELVALPADSIEEAEEYFKENEELHCPPSQYDCTGNLFTKWHKTVKRTDGFYVYHSVGADL